MINDLYKNIIDSFNIAPTLEPKKQVENKEIKELEKIVMIILNPKSNKSAKKKAIKIIKNKIQNIGETHHLRIDRLIHLGRIDTEELDFALEIICDTKKSKNLFNQISEYKEISFSILSIQKDIINKQNKINEIKEYLNQIKKISNANYSKNPIKKIIEKRKRKKQVASIKNKLLNEINKITLDIKEQNILKEALSKKPFNVEEFEHTILKQINKQIQNLNQEYNEKSSKLFEKRSIIPIKQDKLNRILSFQKDDFLSIIAQTSFRKNSKKKNEFISKIIFILKLIDFVEKNDVTALNELTKLMQQKIKLENANQITEEKQVERKR